MRIVQLNAENIKRLRAVEITPDENVVVIAGRNAQGKTSVLDAIWLALGGGSASRETPRVIRDGEDEANVTIDLGDFTVTRTWKNDKTTLAVLSKDGAKYSSPQTFLDEKLGALSFDPLAFAQDDAKKQLATLLNLVDLPFDPDELANHRRGVFDDRTELGRSLAQAKARLASAPKFDVDTPDEEVSTADIVEEQRAFEGQRDAFLKFEKNEEELVEGIEHIRSVIEQMETSLAAAKTRLEGDTHILSMLRETAPAEPDRPDFAGRLADLESTNMMVRAKREYRTLQNNVTSIQENVDVLTATLGLIDQRKADALAEAKMPIDGLGFDDDGVTYNGVPFKQASGAEQLRVSIAMAMAMNPTIRVIRISDGSLLDRENMAIIADMAADQDYQVWIERVDEDGGVGFTIEDGEVVGHEGEWTRVEKAMEEIAETTGYARVSINEADPPIAKMCENAQARLSMCPMCGETKPSDPTSGFFEARPDKEFDSDWDGCSQGSGT